MCRNTYKFYRITFINPPLWDWAQPFRGSRKDDVRRASNLEVPVDGALAGHCEVSALRVQALPIRVHPGVKCAMSP
jgi:hypothetical protein